MPAKQPKEMAVKATAAETAAWRYKWEPWSKDVMDKALAEGRPVYVDFTAQWCATCIANKKVAYSSEVKDLMRKGNVLMLRADKTKPNPAIDAEMRSLNRSSIPVNVLYMPGREPAITREILTPDYLASFLKAHLFGEGDVSAMVEEPEKVSSIWVILGSLFLGGLILNLMPCVFPVIGLKILGFVEMGGGDRKKVFAHSMSFSFGVLLSFWLLTLVIFYLRAQAGGEAQSWGAWLQNPWVIYGIILIFLTMGLSMFGLFEIGVGATGAGSSLQSRKGYIGSFFSGLLATVVATPCSAPFLGPVMASVMAFDAGMMFLSMTCMGLGLALPYLLMGAFPALVKSLPKPGAWMESLKQGMSFLLLGLPLISSARTMLSSSTVSICRWSISSSSCLPRDFGCMAAGAHLSSEGDAPHGRDYRACARGHWHLGLDAGQAHFRRGGIRGAECRIADFLKTVFQGAGLSCAFLIAVPDGWEAVSCLGFPTQGEWPDCLHEKSVSPGRKRS